MFTWPVGPLVWLPLGGLPFRFVTATVKSGPVLTGGNAEFTL